MAPAAQGGQGPTRMAGGTRLHAAASHPSASHCEGSARARARPLGLHAGPRPISVNSLPVQPSAGSPRLSLSPSLVAVTDQFPASHPALQPPGSTPTHPVETGWGERLFWGGYTLCALGFALGEWVAGGFEQGPVHWLLAAPADTLVSLLLLICGPIAWRTQRTRRGAASPRSVTLASSSSDTAPSELVQPVVVESAPRDPLWGCALPLVVALSLGVCWWSAGPLRGLPPAFHDEYSYLFQAGTYLEGRLSFDSPPLRELFDQVHVLNEGRLASRYFPATGLWLAPWLAAGLPGLGWWAAQALLTGLVYLWAKELAGPVCGLLAATLCALSPGLVLFSQLLLAHHPTLLGLAVFHWASLKALRGHSRRWATCAGVGLAWAMLCRPMTAAGAALPLGLWLLWQGVWHRRLLGLWLPLGLPLVAGLAVQVGCNLAITGQPLTTPYGLYTRLHTPRHQYGFNNVVRGERQLGPRVHAHYDQWAENLTGELAWQNVRRRLWTSGQWTLGVLPLLFALGASLAGGGGLPPQFRWLPASIVSLHVVHIPYWFSGIFHFHYVFETLVLWLIWLAVVGVTAARHWRQSGRTLLPVWGGVALGAALLLCYTLPEGLWNAPFLAGRSQLEFARRKHASFLEVVSREVTERPALVLVEPDPADRHLDFVTNLPPLTGPVLIGRYRPDLYDHATVAAAFPERALYRYRVTTRELSRWRGD